jgi:hypothetical protein
MNLILSCPWVEKKVLMYMWKSSPIEFGSTSHKPTAAANLMGIEYAEQGGEKAEPLYIFEITPKDHCISASLTKNGTLSEFLSSDNQKLPIKNCRWRKIH